MTGIPFEDTVNFTEEATKAYADTLCRELKKFGGEKMAITGLHYNGNIIGTYGYDNGESFLYGREYVKKSYPGTGDLFASVLLGELLKGKNFRESMRSASDFTRKVIEYSSQFNTPVRNGVAFEPFLSELGK